MVTFYSFFGLEQGQAFGVPAAHPHPKIWEVPPGFEASFKVLCETEGVLCHTNIPYTVISHWLC